MKTFVAKPETVKRDWYVVDATGKTLGRLATELARRLRGKHKAEYTPHVDTGDYIIVINADKVAVTGNKESDKIYYCLGKGEVGSSNLPMGTISKLNFNPFLTRSLKLIGNCHG